LSRTYDLPEEILDKVSRFLGIWREEGGKAGRGILIAFGGMIII